MFSMGARIVIVTLGLSLTGGYASAGSFGEDLARDLAKEVSKASQKVLTTVIKDALCRNGYFSHHPYQASFIAEVSGGCIILIGGALVVLTGVGIKELVKKVQANHALRQEALKNHEDEQQVYQKGSSLELAAVDGVVSGVGCAVVDHIKEI